MKQSYLKIFTIVCILFLVSTSISAQILPEMESYIPKISQPNLSPSGDEILFSGEDYHGLYLLTLKTNQVETIANNPGAGYRASWSSDGAKIGFKLIHNENQQQLVYYDTQKKVITPLYPISANAGVPSFSKNGLIAFTIGNMLHIVDQNLHSIFKNDLSSYVNLTPISPDGEFVVYNDLNDQLWLLELKNGATRQITSGKEGYFNPIWSPNSKKIIFSSLTGYLFTVAIETENQYLIGRGSSPNWLEDGNNLVFCEEQWDNLFQLISSRIVICRYDGTSKKYLNESQNQTTRFVHYSPQNKKLVYISKNNLVVEKIHKFSPRIETEIEKSFSIDELSRSTEATKIFPKKTSPNPDNQIEAQTFNAPYLHQVYDTPNWFNGHWACGATSAMMALVYYDVLPTWPCTCSRPYTHTSNYGRYICEVYSFNGYTYNIGGYDPDGNLGYGGYGFIIQNNWANTKDYMAKYARQHKTSSSVDWNPSFSKLSLEINKTFPVVILNSLTSSGHYILGIGYNNTQRSVIINDPYGDKNQGYMNYNGKNVVYDWPGYNNGHANLNTVHCLIYMRLDRTDLTLSAFSLADTLEIGQEVPLEFKIYNKGLIPADSCSVGIYLSSNLLLNSISIPQIDTGDSLTIETIVQLPDSLPSSKLSIGVLVDENDSLNEVNESNNLYHKAFVLKGYPLLYRFYPSPDATINTTRPQIRARVKDDYFGIDVASIKFYLDDVDVTSASNISNNEITFTPDSDLTLTTHTVKLEVTNLPGYTARKEWEFNIIISEVKSKNDLSKPKWNLAQNYPNPFNNSTQIQFELAKAEHVKIEIFSVDGALTTTLVDEYKGAGIYKCVWHGTNEQNRKVASGIYYYRMTGNGFQEIKKMLYLK